MEQMNPVIGLEPWDQSRGPANWGIFFLLYCV